MKNGCFNRPKDTEESREKPVAQDYQKVEDGQDKG